MRRGRILIILGILLGVITFAAVFYLLTTVPAGAGEPPPTVDLVVALQEIPERTQIQAPWVGKASFLEETAPQGAMQNLEDVIGKITLERIYLGEPVLDVNLALTATLYGVPYLLPDGAVAVAFPIAEVSGVAGAIREGDTVDVLLTMDVPPTEGEPGGGRLTTQVTLQDVVILNVGEWLGPGAEATGEAPTVLILQMNRQDALILKWARENGIVDLALRPATDHNLVDIGTIDPVHVDYMIDTYRLPRPPVVAQ